MALVSDEHMSRFTWLLAWTVTKQYTTVTSEYAKDKKWEKKYRWIAKKWYINTDFNATIWCIDEKFIKNEYYTVFSVIENGKQRMIAMVQWTVSKSVIWKLCRGILRDKRLKFTQISADMSPTMHAIIRSLFPNALIVDDRFHVQKNIYEDMQAIRQRLKTQAKTQERKSKRKPKKYENWETRLQMITRVMWQLVLPKERRSSVQRERWAIAKSTPWFKALVAGYETAMWLRDIYEMRIGKEMWKLQLNAWIVKAKRYRRVPEILAMAHLIEKRLETVSNFFVSRHNNWRAENLNMRIGYIVRDSRWFQEEDYMVFRFIKALW